MSSLTPDNAYNFTALKKLSNKKSPLQIGIIRIEPSQVLRDGLRREIVKRYAHFLHTIDLPRAEEALPVEELCQLANRLWCRELTLVDTLSDYVPIDCVRLCNEERIRVIGAATTLDSNSLLLFRLFYRARV